MEIKKTHTKENTSTLTREILSSQMAVQLVTQTMTGFPLGSRWALGTPWDPGNLGPQGVPLQLPCICLEYAWPVPGVRQAYPAYAWLTTVVSSSTSPENVNENSDAK